MANTADQRYLDWFDRFPLTKMLVEEMLAGQRNAHTHAIFDLSAPLWVLDLEDRTTERLERLAGKG